MMRSSACRLQSRFASSLRCQLAKGNKSRRLLSSSSSSTSTSTGASVQGSTQTTVRTVTDAATGEAKTYRTEITKIFQHWSQVPRSVKVVGGVYLAGMVVDMTRSAFQDATGALFSDRSNRTELDVKFPNVPSQLRSPEAIRMREWKVVTEALGKEKFSRLCGSFVWPSGMLSGAMAPVVLWMNPAAAESTAPTVPAGSVSAAPAAPPRATVVKA
jgi:hypothetical protein